MVSLYYDRNGRPITVEEWQVAFEKDRTVAKTELPWGGMVSTVWLGLDHNFWGGKPLIFETMVFGPDDFGRDLDMDRYSTEAEALIGHVAMVKKWQTRLAKEE